LSIKIDLDSIVNGKNNQTNFTSQLLRLLMKSDGRHKELLRVSFPNEVQAVEQFQSTGEILDLPSA